MHRIALTVLTRAWDGKVVTVQVTDTKASTVEVRILVSAGTAGKAWNLRCEVREKIIAFLQREHPQALPRRRFEHFEDEGRHLLDHAPPRPESERKDPSTGK